MGAVTGSSSGRPPGPSLICEGPGSHGRVGRLRGLGYRPASAHGEAVRGLAGLVVDTGITMSLDDAVQMVEDGLPADYPVPAVSGIAGRRAMIARMARGICGGDAYED